MAHILYTTAEKNSTFFDAFVPIITCVSVSRYACLCTPPLEELVGVLGQTDNARMLGAARPYLLPRHCHCPGV